jgi:hypothetical protein
MLMIVSWVLAYRAEKEEVSVYDIAEQKSKKFRHGGIVINTTNQNVGEVLGMSIHLLRFLFFNDIFSAFSHV